MCIAADKIHSKCLHDESKYRIKEHVHCVTHCGNLRSLSLLHLQTLILLQHAIGSKPAAEFETSFSESPPLNQGPCPWIP